MVIFYDYVLDEKGNHIFGGTPVEVTEWLEDERYSWALDLHVWAEELRTYLPARNYLEMRKQSRELHVL